MATRPTAVQETAIRTAMDSERIGDASRYADRTLDIMQRNGWITRPDSSTYRVTAEAARTIGKFTLAEKYQTEDLLETDPKAQRQASVMQQARESGVTVFARSGVTETLLITVEDLERLLATSRPLAYAA